MKFPSWSDFRDGATKFEHYIYDEKAKAAEKIQGLKDDHPVFDQIIKRAIPFLPSPFNGIAQGIYSSFEGPKKDKVDEVLKFLEKIQSQTEEQYKQITSRLGDVLGEISGIKAIVAKESTLELIKEILISRDNTINQKLDLLKNQLDSIKKLHEKLERELYQSYGLNWLPPNYFQVHSDTDENFGKWKEGFSFELPSIKKSLEYRRNIVDDIKSRLEAQHSLLMVGESGTSKSTILMEIISDYFDDGYEILYNWGTEIKNGDQLLAFVEDILKDGSTKVLVAVDNAHEERTSAIFYVIDKLSMYYLRKNARFIITARLPEFDRFEQRLRKVQEIYSGSLRNLIDNHSSFRYDLPLFTTNEIKEFIIKYDKSFKASPIIRFRNGLLDEFTAEMREKIYEQMSKKIFDYTKGHPLLVKFYVLGGKELRKDVEDRFRRHLEEDEEKIKIMVICSLLDIATVTITDKLLEEMGVLEHAYDLNRATVYHSKSEKVWKTLHPRWDRELLSYLYGTTDEGTLYKRQKYLEKGLDAIFNTKDEKISSSVIQTIYDISTTNIQDSKGILPIDVVENVMENRMPDYLSDNTKSYLYGTIIAFDYYQLKRYNDVIDNCNEALKVDPNDATAWLNKGSALGSLGRYEEAITSYDKATKINPNDADAWNNRGLALANLGRYEEAIGCFDVVLAIDPNNADALNYKVWIFANNKNKEALHFAERSLEIDPNNAAALDIKGFIFYNLNQYEKALEYYDKALSLEPNNPETWNHKGSVLDKVGRRDEAQNCFDKAKELGLNI